jgi:transcriptional regulator
MYIPLLFRESDPAYIKGFLQSHGFATLVSCDQGRPIATHLLLETQGADDSQLVLSGHMSRENPQWRTFDPANEVLAIFPGPHSYVSAAWYSVPSAPTWNYISVHVYGRPRLIEDRGELYAMLKRLVDAQEGRYPKEKRYTIESLPAGILEGMMNGVAGFQIAVTRVEAAAKLSQNRSAPDQQRIIDALRAEESPGSLGIAREMERRGEGLRENG